MEKVKTQSELIWGVLEGLGLAGKRGLDRHRKHWEDSGLYMKGACCPWDPFAIYCDSSYVMLGKSF